jgi:ABC-type bacteriocin/lantibiotic exporter with double-glycine peptidase domain
MSNIIELFNLFKLSRQTRKFLKGFFINTLIGCAVVSITVGSMWMAANHTVLLFILIFIVIVFFVTKFLEE